MSDGGEPLPSASLYPFPMHQWRMVYDLRQAARLELARLLLSGEEAPKARGMLTKLAEEMRSPADVYGPPWQAAWLAKRFPGWLVDRK